MWNIAHTELGYLMCPCFFRVNIIFLELLYAPNPCGGLKTTLEHTWALIQVSRLLWILTCDLLFNLMNIRRRPEDHFHAALVGHLPDTIIEPPSSPMAFDRVENVYRSCLLQIILVGLVAFCEPGIWTALNNLGAGGNASARHF